MTEPTTTTTTPSDEKLDEAQQRLIQLQHALQSRIILEQARGVLRERFGLTLEQAFNLLRSSARSNRQNIHQLAAEIVHHQETPGAVIRVLAQRSEYVEVADERLDRVTVLASQLRQARLQQARNQQEGMRRRR